MDVEEYARKKIAGGKVKKPFRKIWSDIISSFKTVTPSYASAFARAVIDGGEKYPADCPGTFLHSSPPG